MQLQMQLQIKLDEDYKVFLNKALPEAEKNYMEQTCSFYDAKKGKWSLFERRFEGIYKCNDLFVFLGDSRA